MRLRTFTAPTMSLALAQVREALGDDAVILSSKEQPHLNMVSITAAVEQDEDALAHNISSKVKPTKSRDETSIANDQLRYDVQSCLRFHTIPEHFISKMLTLLNEATLATVLASGRLNIPNDHAHFMAATLEHISERFFHYAPFPANTPARLMLVGAPGIGKTLAIAKFATQATLAKQPVCVITTDNKRAGGIEQLSALTDILQLPLMVCDSGKSLAKTIIAQPKTTSIFVDTAGCNPYDKDEMDELKTLVKHANLEPVLALAAGNDSMETLENTEAFCTLPIKRVLITRADSSRRFGNVFAAACAHDLAFSHISNSASPADALVNATPKSITQLFTRYLLQTP